MPGTSSRRYGAKRYAKKSTKKKAAISRYGASARKRRNLATAVKRTKRVAPAVKKAVVSNTRAIAKLKDQTFGTLQHNEAIFDTASMIVSDDRPCCLHLSNLQAGGANAPKWIRPKHQILGSIKPTLDDYDTFNDWRRPVNHMDQIVHTQDQPEGDRVLWKSTRLDFCFQGWVEEAYIDVLIVQQKVTDIRDPWRNNIESQTPHGHYLPYCLNTFRNSAGPRRETKIDPKQFRVLKRRRIYLNSLGYTVDHTIAHDTFDGVTGFAEAVTGNSEGNDAQLVAKSPTTSNKKYCSLTIYPNKIIKRLYSETHLLGFEPTNVAANPSEEKTGAPFDFDNQEPKDNIFCIVTSSDEGDYEMHR